jgi:chemotaxis signal transduction protein
MQHLVVTAAGQSFAIPSSRVVEVIPPIAVAALAGLPDWMPGCIRYRGALVPLVDLGRRLEATRAPVRASPVPSESDAPPVPSAGGPARLGNRLIIMKTAEGREERRLGLRVDAVLSLAMIDSPPSAAESCDNAGASATGGPTPRLPEESWIGPVVEWQGRTIQLLEPGAILPGRVWERVLPATRTEGEPSRGQTACGNA